MRKLNSQTVQILLVEDDEIDAEAVQRAFKKQKVANPIHAVCNGLNALEVVRGHSEVEPLTKHYIVLLDLNIPKMNGIEFLHEVRALADRWRLVPMETFPD